MKQKKAANLLTAISELIMGFEPMTSSLPRKCSTPELHQQLFDL